MKGVLNLTDEVTSEIVRIVVLFKLFDRRFKTWVLCRSRNSRTWRVTSVELQFDALLLNERDEALAVLSDVALDAGVFRKFRAFCLADIENIRRAEANQYRSILSGDVLFGFIIGLPLNSNDGSEDANAALALLDGAASWFHA